MYKGGRQGVVVHRDLKPDNIFVISVDPPRLKLLDFGIAKLVESEERPELTASGTFMGTPYYVSPEQGQGQISRIGPWSDIYSLGAVLYQMLCGKTPFSEASVALLIAAHVKETPTPLADLAPGVPAGVAAVVHRCLEKEPELRVGSARELFEGFRHGLAGKETMPIFAGAPEQQGDAGLTHKGTGPVRAPAKCRRGDGASADPESVALLPRLPGAQEWGRAEALPANSDAPAAGDGGVSAYNPSGQQRVNTTMGASTGQVTLELDRGGQKRRGLSAMALVGTAVLVAAGLLVYALSPDTAEDPGSQAESLFPAATPASGSVEGLIAMPVPPGDEPSSDLAGAGTSANAPEPENIKPGAGTASPAPRLDTGTRAGQNRRNATARPRREELRKTARKPWPGASGTQLTEPGEGRRRKVPSSIDPLSQIDPFSQEGPQHKKEMEKQPDVQPKAPEEEAAFDSL